MATVEFFFDCSSPWTYLAFTRIQPLCAETGAELVWKPILVGGVFNAVNDSVYRDRENPIPAKAAYVAKDIQSWADYCGVRILWRPSIFPVNAVKCMRGCLVALDQDRLPAFAQAVFEAYWRDDRDVSEDDVLTDLAAAVGLDAAHLLARIAEPEIKARLRANTDELIARGGFGSPTIYVDSDDMYFGNDRLPLVAAAIEKAGT